MVVLLADQFAQGVDILFNECNANVVVFWPKSDNPLQHVIRQMFGRGMRDHKTNKGTLFAVGTPSRGVSLFNHVDGNPDFAFQHGDQNLATAKKEMAKPTHRGK